MEVGPKVQNTKSVVQAAICQAGNLYSQVVVLYKDDILVSSMGSVEICLQTAKRDGSKRPCPLRRQTGDWRT